MPRDPVMTSMDNASVTTSTIIVMSIAPRMNKASPVTTIMLSSRPMEILMLLLFATMGTTIYQFGASQSRTPCLAYTTRCLCDQGGTAAIATTMAAQGGT